MSQPYRFLPSLDEEKLHAIQLEGLRWTVRHAYEGSPRYRAKLRAAGVVPDDIVHLDDVRRLPFTTVADLRDD